jgi:phosphoribosyl-ATP pyrophosphohydrolase/phosphoribosyl-AMP cyclohydrolase
MIAPELLKWDDHGLITAVVQDAATREVLMVAWMNAEALRATETSGEAHFWSRSRRELWHKGATSGHIMKLVELRVDCDADTLLLLVEPAGPACHTGARTCFGEPTPTLGGVLDELRRVVESRALTAPEGSYTARLLAKGLDSTLKKIGEEATEVVLAAKGESDERLAEEAADLLFHLLVALHQRGLEPAAALEVLKRRRGAK